MGYTYIKLLSLSSPPLIFYFILRSFYVVTNKWTKYTSYEVNEENLCILRAIYTVYANPRFISSNQGKIQRYALSFD